MFLTPPTLVGARAARDTQTVILLLVSSLVVLIVAIVAIARALRAVGDERVPAASDPGDSARDILSVDLTDRD